MRNFACVEIRPEFHEHVSSVWMPRRLPYYCWGLHNSFLLTSALRRTNTCSQRICGDRARTDYWMVGATHCIATTIAQRKNYHWIPMKGFSQMRIACLNADDDDDRLSRMTSPVENDDSLYKYRWRFRAPQSLENEDRLAKVSNQQNSLLTSARHSRNCSMFSPPTFRSERSKSFGVHSSLRAEHALRHSSTSHIVFQMFCASLWFGNSKSSKKWL